MNDLFCHPKRTPIRTSLMGDERSRRQRDYLERLRQQKSSLHFPTLGGAICVRPGVAHPKSDTHLLTLAALPLARGRVLDAFCGSGPVGLALAKQCESCTFLDVSNQAIENAIENASALQVRDVCHFITGTPSDLEDEKPFDLIVANPPYTNAKTADDIDRICFDPDHATLTSLIAVAQRILAPNGRLMLTWPDYSSFGRIESMLSERLFDHRIVSFLTEPLYRFETTWDSKVIEYRVYDSYLRAKHFQLVIPDQIILPES